MTFISYAQNFEDVMLWRALRDVRPGFYVDVGAWEPTEQSVTQAFYERGWSGINLEPSPDVFARLNAARPRDINLQVAAGAMAGEQDFLVVHGDNGLSTLRTDARTRLETDGWQVSDARIAVRRLADIFRDHAQRDIHFLKIDAEGTEREVLEGADLEHWRPWIVVVEATVVNSAESNHHLWEDVLLTRRYRSVYADGLNRFYIAEERGALAVAFATPPNIFDQFVRVDDHAARLALLAQADRLQRAEAALDSLRGWAGSLEQEAKAGGDRLETLTASMSAMAERETVLLAERDIAVQEMWESNRLAAVLASDRQTLIDQLADFERTAAAKLRAELAAVHESTSWRITAPLRAIRRLGKAS